METHEIMTVDEAASYLRMKRSSLQQKVREGKVPYTALGEKTVVFVKRFLDIWLALETRGADAEEIRKIEFSRTGNSILPGNLAPLSDSARRQIAKSERDIQAGHVTKLAD